MAIHITRLEHSPAEPRHTARIASDPDQARRLLAIASVLEGAGRTDAARSAGMERQTLRDWVRRFNAEGIEGLKDRPRSGRKPLLDGEQLLELDRLVETPPDGVVRWRCCDLKAKIESRFDVEISERSAGRILRTRKFRRLGAQVARRAVARRGVRPKHAKGDEAFQQTSKTILPPHYGKLYRSMPRPSPSRSGSRTRPALARKER